MKDAYVRLESVELNGFKNVEHGKLSFENPRRTNGPSILGLYGQNGSGKSALMDTLGLLKLLLANQKIDPSYIRDINVEACEATIVYGFSINFPKHATVYHVRYTVTINRTESTATTPTSPELGQTPQQDPIIKTERLDISTEAGGHKTRKIKFFDTAEGSVFGPKAKFKEIIGPDKDEEIELRVEKRLAYREGRSFLFAPTLLTAVYGKANANAEATTEEGNDPNCPPRVLRRILNALRMYGVFELFVLDSSDIGMVSIGMLPFAFRIGQSVGQTRQVTAGRQGLPMDKSAVIEKAGYSAIQSAIQNMDIVLQQIVPGLTVGIRELGDELTPEGEEGIRIQLVSRRDGRELPLQCESEGIKRIVSFLNLLILMYNDPSVTVAIDEIDSGIFEYLLGELLGIVSQHGKGQLIFTSHNLRPLETIDRGFIAFTTTNPKERYTRLANVKPSNNLRDLYYRGIVLGGQREELYEETNNGDIAFAFMRAGASNEG